MDGLIDAGYFGKLRADIKKEQRRVTEDMERHQAANHSYMDEGIRLLELAAKAPQMFQEQDSAGKAKLLGFVHSNSVWTDGELAVEYRQPFDALALAASHVTPEMVAETAQTGDVGIWLPEANNFSNSRSREQSGFPVSPGCSLVSKSVGFGTEANTVANSWLYRLTGRVEARRCTERAGKGPAKEAT